MSITPGPSLTVNPEIFARILFKRRICDVKNSLGHDLPISVEDRVILQFGEGFIFTQLRSWEVL